MMVCRGGETHHYQLTRAFRNIGAKLLLDDEEFGDPETLCQCLDAETAHFARLARKLYARSLGPWCAVEMMSDDWMRALADALSAHFPRFAHEPYFEECFSQGVEARHANEALAVTQMVLNAHPELLHETLRDARMMAEALDGVWNQLDQVVEGAARRRTRLVYPPYAPTTTGGPERPDTELQTKMQPRWVMPCQSARFIVCFDRTTAGWALLSRPMWYLDGLEPP